MEEDIYSPSLLKAKILKTNKRMQKITLVQRGTTRKPAGAPADGAGRGCVKVLQKGWGRWEKLYLCERTWIDRRAMRVSTKFRANKSVSEAGEKKTSTKIQTDHFSANCKTN